MKRIWIATLCLFGALQLSAQEPLKDWANFGKYEQENAAIKQPVKVVFMGNSITEGWRATDPDFFTKNNYAGRGISGQVSAQMLMRFRPDVIDLEPLLLFWQGQMTWRIMTMPFLQKRHLATLCR